MARIFHLLIFRHANTGQSGRYRFLTYHSSLPCIGDSFLLACGEAVPDLGDLRLVIKKHSDGTKVVSKKPNGWRSDKYAVLGVEVKGKVRSLTVTSFATFVQYLRDEGWHEF